MINVEANMCCWFSRSVVSACIPLRRNRNNCKSTSLWGATPETQGKGRLYIERGSAGVLHAIPLWHANRLVEKNNQNHNMFKLMSYSINKLMLNQRDASDRNVSSTVKNLVQQLSHTPNGFQKQT